MKFYKVNQDFYPKKTGLYAGYYLKSELHMDFLMFDNLLSDGVISIVNEPYTCLLIDSKGFEKRMHFRTFQPVIEVANAVDFALNPISTKDRQYKQYADEYGKVVFMFERKEKGKNEFVYVQE